MRVCIEYRQWYTICIKSCSAIKNQNWFGCMGWPQQVPACGLQIIPEMGVGRVALKIADYKNGGVFWSEPVGHFYVNVGISDLMKKLTLHPHYLPASDHDSQHCICPSEQLWCGFHPLLVLRIVSSSRCLQFSWTFRNLLKYSKFKCLRLRKRSRSRKGSWQNRVAYISRPQGGQKLNFFNLRHQYHCPKWNKIAFTKMLSRVHVLFCSLAVLDPRVGHTMDVLSPFIPVLCHSDWLFHGESYPRLDVVHPGRAWPSPPSCTWHCSLHYLFLQATPFLVVWP